MALTSVFYDGPVTDTQRAQNRTGAPDYGVYRSSDFQVVSNPGSPFTVKVNPGKAHGWGVTDETTAAEIVTCSSLASGTRWDLIVIRRKWQPGAGGKSTLVAIPGGAFTNIPAARKTGPGVEDDQPIAFVCWKGGQSAPVQIIDLRAWASNGGYEIASEICFDFMGRPGTALYFQGQTWHYARGANAVWGWECRDPIIQTGSVMTGAAKPETSPFITWTGPVWTKTGSGGEKRDAALATNAVGVGGLWFGYGGLPRFQGIYSVQLTGFHPLEQYLHIPELLSVNLTRLKFKARRLDGSGWANGFGEMTNIVTVVGW